MRETAPIDVALDDARAGRATRERLPEWARYIIHILGVTSLVIAQPVLGLLGENPTYFVAHRATRIEILLVVAAVIAIPALVVAGPVLVVRAASRRAGAVAAGVAVGLLVTLAVLRLFDSVPLTPFILVVVVGTVLVAWRYVRGRAIQLFASYLGWAPLLFAALFVFTSGASPLVFGTDDAEVLTAQRSRAPVVILLLDELPLGAMLTGDGSINSARFPGFAELAELSTWYPRATTVATYTYWAVPALLTGRLPDPEAPPVAGYYPRSIFTMLGSRKMHVGEQVTRLCPDQVCSDTYENPADSGSLVDDTTLVSLHELLPATLADRWLPPITGSWTNFGEQLEATPLPEDGLDIDFAEWRAQWRAGEWESAPGGSFDEFLASLSPEQQPTVWYRHEMLPHMPYRLLPDGRVYQGTRPRALRSEEQWVTDPAAVVNAQQRLLLQLKYVDAQVGLLLDALRSARMLDDTMLVVASDHGIDFAPGSHRRGGVVDGGRESDEATSRYDEVLPIALFVKYPGQAVGKIDDRPAQSIDVLPTLADALGAALPDEWEFDGHSLLEEPTRDSRPAQMTGWDEVEQLAAPPDATRVAARFNALFDDHRASHDVYAVGPHHGLLGRPVSSIGELASATIEPTDPSIFAAIDLGSSSVPALFTAELSGVDSGEWIAIVLNERVAGLGPVYTDAEGRSVVEVMVDPSLMVDGANAADAYVIDDNGDLQRVAGW